LEFIKSVGYVLKFKRFYTIFEIGEGIAGIDSFLSLDLKINYIGTGRIK